MSPFDAFLAPMVSTLEKLCELNAYPPAGESLQLLNQENNNKYCNNVPPADWVVVPSSSSDPESRVSSDSTSSSSSYNISNTSDSDISVPSTPVSKLPENPPPSRFYATTRPTISIRDYLIRIHRYADCSDTCFILALIYIDRLIQGNSVAVNFMTIHRLLITGIAVAAKFFDDLHYANSHYSRVGGVPLTELNHLELQYLFALQFNLSVDPDTFALYNEQLNQIYRKPIQVTEPEVIDVAVAPAPSKIDTCSSPRQRSRRYAQKKPKPLQSQRL